MLTVRLKAPIDPPQPRGFEEGALGTDTTESICKMVNLIVRARRTNHTASDLGLGWIAGTDRYESSVLGHSDSVSLIYHVRVT